MEFSPEPVRAQMRRRYQRVASLLIDETSGATVADPVFLESGEEFGSALYSANERRSVPVAALAASLGCGSPTADAGLQPGQRILDLGCGGGIDVLLSARAVGDRRIVIGLDLAPAMLRLTQDSVRRSRAENVHLLIAAMERLPFRTAAFDVVISNCSVNLSGDKAAVLAEVGRVLRPEGRLHLTDVVAEDSLTPAERLDRAHETGLTVGALSRSEHVGTLRQAGFADITVALRHRVADRMAAASIMALIPNNA